MHTCINAYMHKAYMRMHPYVDTYVPTYVHMYIHRHEDVQQKQV